MAVGRKKGMREGGRGSEACNEQGKRELEFNFEVLCIALYEIFRMKIYFVRMGLRQYKIRLLKLTATVALTSLKQYFKTHKARAEKLVCTDSRTNNFFVDHFPTVQIGSFLVRPPFLPLNATSTPISFSSLFNAVFAIVLYESLCYMSWSFMPAVLRHVCAAIFGFLCILQVFGLVQELRGDDWMRNPVAGEWTKLK